MTRPAYSLASKRPSRSSLVVALLAHPQYAVTRSGGEPARRRRGRGQGAPMRVAGARPSFQLPELLLRGCGGPSAFDIKSNAVMADFQFLPSSNPNHARRSCMPGAPLHGDGDEPRQAIADINRIDARREARRFAIDRRRLRALTARTAVAAALAGLGTCVIGRHWGGHLESADPGIPDVTQFRGHSAVDGPQRRAIRGAGGEWRLTAARSSSSRRLAATLRASRSAG